jgi:hypothetical protein
MVHKTISFRTRVSVKKLQRLICFKPFSLCGEAILLIKLVTSSLHNFRWHVVLVINSELNTHALFIIVNVKSHTQFVVSCL